MCLLQISGDLFFRNSSFYIIGVACFFPLENFSLIFFPNLFQRFLLKCCQDPGTFPRTSPKFSPRFSLYFMFSGFPSSTVFSRIISDTTTGTLQAILFGISDGIPRTSPGAPQIFLPKLDQEWFQRIHSGVLPRILV